MGLIYAYKPSKYKIKKGLNVMETWLSKAVNIADNTVLSFPGSRYPQWNVALYMVVRYDAMNAWHRESCMNLCDREAALNEAGTEVGPSNATWRVSSPYLGWRWGVEARIS